MADDRTVEDYRRHQLVASGRGAEFVGKAWKDNVAVLDARGSSLEEVLNSLKVGIDKLLAGRADAARQPSASHYVSAFRKIIPSLSDGHFAMLRAHYRAPNRSLTATELAKAAGYANYNAANLQYGSVGKLLWEELPTKLPIGPDGAPIYTFALAELSDQTAPNDQWVWRMRPEIAAALLELGLDK